MLRQFFMVIFRLVKRWLADDMTAIMDDRAHGQSHTHLRVRVYVALNTLR